MNRQPVDELPRSTVSRFIENEEANLLDIQNILSRSFDSFLQNSDQHETAHAMTELLTFQEVNQHRIQTRRKAIQQLFQNTDCEPDQRRINQNKEQLSTLRKQVAEAIGRRRVFAICLLTHQRIVETTLESLGVVNIQDRYNAAGEKLPPQATPSIQ